MDSTILVAIIAFFGTTLGSVFGIMTSNKLVAHRLEQLEIRVGKHNNLVERMIKVEHYIKDCNQR